MKKAIKEFIERHNLQFVLRTFITLLTLQFLYCIFSPVPPNTLNNILLLVTAILITWWRKE